MGTRRQLPRVQHCCRPTDVNAFEYRATKGSEPLSSKADTCSSVSLAVKANKTGIHNAMTNALKLSVTERF